jgi:hypothetical protein
MENKASKRICHEEAEDEDGDEKGTENDGRIHTTDEPASAGIKRDGELVTLVEPEGKVYAASRHTEIGMGYANGSSQCVRRCDVFTSVSHKIKKLKIDEVDKETKTYLDVENVYFTQQGEFPPKTDLFGDERVESTIHIRDCYTPTDNAFCMKVVEELLI